MSTRLSWLLVTVVFVLSGCASNTTNTAPPPTAPPTQAPIKAAEPTKTTAPAPAQPTVAPAPAQPAALPDAGKPSQVDARIRVPSEAVRQDVSDSEKYLVPGSKAQDLLAFYQRTLPADGWKIDTKTSDLEGKSPGTGGIRTINVCAAPATWRAVLFNDESNGLVLIVMALPDTDPCK